MKTQFDLFNDKASVLARDVLKERIKNTNFNASHPSFTITKWQSTDDQLPIFYRIVKTELGDVLIAATQKGLTHLGFVIKDNAAAIADLKRRFSNNVIIEENNEWISIAANRINDPAKESQLNLHLKGTEFQLAIWEKLLLIPFGGLTNYKQLSDGEHDSRAVGSAVGANPVGFLIPCHRVVRADGSFDGFYWGNDVKAKLLTFEAGFEAAC